MLYNLEITLRARASAAQNRKASRAYSSRLNGNSGTIDILLCVVDHFEPSVGQPPREVALGRMADWTNRYPEIAERHRDFDGRLPPHGFFYPWDEYEAEEMEALKMLVQGGYGEVDLHLHHRDDTSESLTQKLMEAISTYSSAGVLPHWRTGALDGKPAFGFIHGNWALDNSRQDGGRNYCGVNNEIEILRDLGCYADFTFPAWGHTAQPRLTNCIYYATDNPDKPKSHNTGTLAKVGVRGKGDLLLIQGAFAPYWKRKKGVPFPAMDDSDLAHYRRYSPARLDRWIETGVHVSGRPDRIYVKLHTHGAEDKNRAILLGEDFDALYSDAEKRYNDGERYRLHYVSAREMYNLVKATETAPHLSIEEARDYVLPPPEIRNKF